MTKPNDESLIGYLLGALEADECAAIEEQLAIDPDLRQRLNELDDQLHAMREDALDESHEPPAFLAERTCAGIDAYEEARRVAPNNPVNERASEPNGWSFVDLVVAGGVCLAVSLLFFPAIVNSRFEARAEACRNNLRELGTSLAMFSEDHGGRFPMPEETGNGACAGYMAPVLNDAGLLNDPEVLICPSSPLARNRKDWYVPTRLELHQAKGQQLILLQRSMGGSYAYAMGYVVDGQLRPTRNNGRPTFVIVADSPSQESSISRSMNHGHRGQNVLFENMSVRFVTSCSLGDLDDSYYLNRRGQPWAGIDVDDCVVGRSDTPPLPPRTRFVRP